jgi:hypothetical protein
MAKHPWPELRRRFIAGEWITLEAMAQQTAVPLSTLYKWSRNEGWIEKRQIADREADAKAYDRLTTRLAREAEKRIPGWLDIADALKFKALQTLTESGMRLNGQEAIRAASEAVAIEARLLMPKQAQDGDSEQRGPLLAFTQINLTTGGPAQLPKPAAFTEANDAQLISLLGKANLDARVVEAEDGDRPGKRGGRAAKKAKRPR